MDRYFSLDLPFPRFLINVVAVSVMALLPLLFVYVLTTPGFGSALLGGGPALSLFLRQVLTNGLPVVVAVNYAGFFLFALARARRRLDEKPMIIPFIDLPIRLAIFILLHIVIYALSADWFGSFGGSRRTALSVVAPTLARSALFDNISGVYLYATMVSALPLYVFAFERSRFLTKREENFPRKAVASALAVLLFGGFVLVLTGLAGIVTGLQSR